MALRDRIVRAAAEPDIKFRVMIVIPLMPGFEGDICDESGSAVVRC